MKKIPHALILLIAAFLLILIASLFWITIGSVANVINLADPDTVTLYSVLSSINYELVLIIFLITACFAFLMDLLLIWIKNSWNHISKTEEKEYKTSLERFWKKHRKIHLTFILITLFVTIGISAPSMVMNAFTAIVSISVLVSNSIKKLED